MLSKLPHTRQRREVPDSGLLCENGRATMAAATTMTTLTRTVTTTMATSMKAATRHSGDELLVLSSAFVLYCVLRFRD